MRQMMQHELQVLGYVADLRRKVACSPSLVVASAKGQYLRYEKKSTLYLNEI